MKNPFPKKNPNKPKGRKRKPSLPKRPTTPIKKFLSFVIKWTGITINVAIKCALLLPIPIFLLWYSYTVDRNGWFQGEQYEREIALAMLDGKPISNFEKMERARELPSYMLKISLKPLKAISIGSSRVLTTNLIYCWH